MKEPAKESTYHTYSPGHAPCPFQEYVSGVDKKGVSKGGDSRLRKGHREGEKNIIKVQKDHLSVKNCGVVVAGEGGEKVEGVQEEGRGLNNRAVYSCGFQESPLPGFLL